uniref:DUF6824 domain-containing protein n=1 Tax=Pseudo-nitzschia australis TaxID=44445 RepID=A0A7S4EIQ2_9STRA|mmetsp:Transcript_22751/g.49479  ORF Transcript_22751/g.49479 Transcript_22751/m.49479 type:complete len:388 (+) Transcript_22751:595-1758(+)|eukprot:CAMPEP_0168176582 /NCGR_PEP_ID=MMETSP0139_2-20121125/7880_1 /TAXON_ID=44445 /ORGANISM="Pseudo-nitzschia australis, Strain 10249 10 AB" /LENGTH=387 /DNA_ID=CAMNT_0008095341 /DNA_START=514 /DNA_END=1677 /DNA_ORIENTATION=+
MDSIIIDGKVHIRTPRTEDVLSGRGGGINNHQGNKVYRSIVKSRKGEYNLSNCKTQKHVIAKEVIQKLKSEPISARFLKKADEHNGNLWVENDEEEVVKKVAQALREGAKAYKEAEQNSQGGARSSSKTNKKRKKKASKPAAKKAAKTGVAINMNAAETMYAKGVEIEASLSEVSDYKSENFHLPTNDHVQELSENLEKAIKDGTPPLASLDDPPHNHIPFLSLDGSQPPGTKDVLPPFVDPFRDEACVSTEFPDALHFYEMCSVPDQLPLSNPVADQRNLFHNANAQPAALEHHEICSVPDQSTENDNESTDYEGCGHSSGYDRNRDLNRKLSVPSLSGFLSVPSLSRWYNMLMGWEDDGSQYYNEHDSRVNGAVGDDYVPETRGE